MTWLAYSALGVPKAVVLTTQPSGAVAGQALAVQPAGKLVDGSGVLARTSGTVVTASKYSGVGTLAGTLTDSTVDGLFAFTDLAMSTVTSAVVLRFEAPSLTTAYSNSFNVTGYTAYSVVPDSGTYDLTGSTANLTYTGTSGVLLFSEGFESGTISANGWFDDGSVPVVADTRTGGSGSNAMSWAWAEAAVQPTGVGSCRVDFGASDSVYCSYWIKFSTNWVGSGFPYHPHMFHLLTNVDSHWIGPSKTHLTTYDEFLYTTGGMVHQMSLQDSLNIDTSNLLVDLTDVTEARAVCGYNGQPETGFSWDTYDNGGGDYRNYKTLVSPSLVITDANKNDWHHVETFWQMNSISGSVGQPDGVMQLWVDDVLIHDRHDVYFRTNANPTMQFYTFVMAPYMQNGSPVAQEIRIDDLQIWTARPPNSTYSVNIASGSYALTGAATSLLHQDSATLALSAGSYVLNGQAVALSKTGTQNPNEPAGYTYINQRSFNAVSETGWGSSGTTYAAIVTDATAPISPSNVMRITYPAGYAAGDAPWHGGYTIGGSRTGLYYHYTLKHSANFQGQSSGTNKIGYIWVHGNPAVFFSAEGTGSGALEAQFRLQNVPDSRGRLRPNLGTTAQQTMVRDVWNDLEIQIIANTPGVANGVARWWLNGVHIGEYTDVQYASAAQANTWQEASIYPIWGGVGGTVTNEMYIYFDHFYMSGA